MRAYDPEWPLFSIHIPKCAGTSLRQVLSGWYRERFYFHRANPATGEKPVRFNLSVGVKRRQRWILRKPYPPCVCVHGHFDYGQGTGVRDYYPDARQFITFLRDPFDIALSIYFFSKAQGENRYVGGQRRPMRDEFSDVSDYMEREVLNKPSIIPNFMPFRIDTIKFERELQKHFIYVGITEDSDKSIERLSQRLGFPHVPIKRINESHWDEPIPDGAREEYRIKHPHEYTLYEYALAHYLD